MATGGKEKVGYSLVRVRTVALENANKSPWYYSIVVCQDKIVVLDIITKKVQIHGLHDGKFLASSDRLKSRPRDMCLMDALTICVLHYGGLIEIMSIDSTDMSRDITTRTLRLQGVLLDIYLGVVRFKDNIVVTGVKQGMMYWCIVSLHDGHVDTIHQICKGDRWCLSRITTKDNIIYISCHAGVKSPNNTGVYGFDILNPSQRKYTYKHQRLHSPTSIVMNEDGNIFVCNHGSPDYCIHQLTASCQLVAIFTQGIPSLQAIFWDNGCLYGICIGSNDITVFCPVYQGSQKASEILVRDERRHPVNEETAIQIGQGNVDKGQSNVKTEMPPSGPSPEDSESRPSPEDAESSPSPEESESSPSPEDSESRPNPEDSESSPGPEDAESRPSTEDSESRPNPEDSEFRPSPEDSESRPSPEDSEARPSPEGSESRPSPEDSESRPSPEDSESRPSPEDSEFRPSPEDSEFRPSPEDSEFRPSPEDSKFRPSPEDSESSVKMEMPPSGPSPEDSKDKKQGSVIPVEILRMDDKSMQLYKEALQDGKEKVYNIRVMVIGQYGVGKTTLTKLLLGQQVDISERTSTEGIDVYKHCCKIALDTGEWIRQHEDSEQLFRLQRLVKLLTHETERPEVSDEQGDQTEFTYQKEATEDLCDPVHYSDSVSEDDDTSANSSGSDLEQEADNTKNQQGESSSFTVNQIPPANDSSGVNIQEGGRHVTSKVNATMELLQLVVEKADKLERSLVEYAALAMWDFAGQYVFYTTHQTFLTCRAIYLLVTDLSQHITDFVEDDECYFDAEGVKLCNVHDLVQVWLNSVHCCAQSSATGTDSKHDNAVTSPAADTLLTSHGASTPAPSLDVGIPVTPPVILVGTHMDKIQQDKRQEVVNNYFQQICHILKDKPSLQHLVGFLAIDNTQSGPQLEALKKRIFQLASQQPYWGEELPANWLPLEEALMKLKASGIKVIPHSLVEKLNQGGAVPIKTTEQLDLFLRFLHETGNILYFSAEGLRDWIVLDPKWLIDAQKSLITAETFILNNYPAVRSMWFEFKETGKLTSPLIDAIWTKEKHPEFHHNKEIILQLMEKLNIVARPRLYNPDSEEVKVDDYFLAPCMLRQATPKDLVSLGPNSQQRNTSVICFVFTEKFLPTPVFHRLLAACVAQWPIARQKMEKLIFCGCCFFDLDLHHRLTLLFREHGIFARVTIIGTTENTLSYKLCIEVREFLTRTLRSIIGCLGQSLQFELSIQCPESERYSVDYQIPVATLQGNVDVPCHFHDKSHVIISHDALKFWFQEEEQSADESSAGHIPSPPTSDTDRFMCIAYLLSDVGSKVLRKLFHHMVITPTCTLDQHLANNRSTINSLLKKRVLNSPQMDIMFPPNGDDTNLDDYDITLLSALFNNIVPSLGHKEMNLVKGLRDDRNKLYGHTKSCMMNASDFQTCWSNISSTLITLSQQCGDPNFENEMLKEIQQTRVPDASYLSILQAWFSRIEKVEQRLKSSETSPTSETKA